MGDNSFNLPPGFRFFPTDEELVVHFLHRKAQLLPCHPDVIPDLDLYPYDPWDLDGKAMAEGRKWYFYSRRTQSRVTESGYWQSIGAEEPSFQAPAKELDYSKWVVCRVYEKGDNSDDEGTELSCLDEVFLSMDDLDEISLPN
ncbi:NAC domain-containing protein [Sesamum angolense]|uniref:NAC domain-containing protein n=1 Tax=Sesamum angolense TaxID=2727404 RepID=A0AAE2C117_9LAMI|nr:NAC domain-containing protein [Sesamum angolense]